MKTESVTIQFDAEKLSAINIYIMEKGLSLEEELQKAAEALYAKHVPANVRAYIDAKNGGSVVVKKKPIKQGKIAHEPVSHEVNGQSENNTKDG